jgi:hypothetical protein
VAFTIGGDDCALPIVCETENPGPVYDKQECETKAFHRLERKICSLYPRIRFHLLLDARYAGPRRDTPGRMCEVEMPGLAEVD